MAPQEGLVKSSRSDLVLLFLFSLDRGSLPILSLLLTFTTFTKLQHGILTPSIAFPSLAIFNSLTQVRSLNLDLPTRPLLSFSFSADPRGIFGCAGLDHSPWNLHQARRGSRLPSTDRCLPRWIGNRPSPSLFDTFSFALEIPQFLFLRLSLRNHLLSNSTTRVIRHRCLLLFVDKHHHLLSSRHLRRHPSRRPHPRLWKGRSWEESLSSRFTWRGGSFRRRTGGVPEKRRCWRREDCDRGRRGVATRGQLVRSSGA